MKDSHSAWRSAELSKKNQAAWDSLYAATSELVWGREPVGFLEPFLTTEFSGRKRFKRILDAGCGEGRNLPILQRFAETLSACDSSPEALAKIPANWRNGVELSKAQLHRTPFADATFDFVLLCDTVETLPDAEAVLREMHRIVAPGGYLLCNIPGPEGDVSDVEMTEIGPDRYLYRSSYFFQFLEGDQARNLLAMSGWEVVRDRLMTWMEPAHPEFRLESHSHRSHVYLLSAGQVGAKYGD
jgi:SAM-dependent methyltransferase